MLHIIPALSQLNIDFWHILCKGWSVSEHKIALGNEANVKKKRSLLTALFLDGTEGNRIIILKKRNTLEKW